MPAMATDYVVDGGTIISASPQDGNAFDLHAGDTLLNNGTIISTSPGFVPVFNDPPETVARITNNGTLRGNGNDAISIVGNLQELINTGLVDGSYGGNDNSAMTIDGDLDNFFNSGTFRGAEHHSITVHGNTGQFLNTGTIEKTGTLPQGPTLSFGGTVDLFDNRGSIAITPNGRNTAIGFRGDVAQFLNSGTISGEGGVSFDDGASVDFFRNQSAGVISGVGGSAVYVSGNGNILINDGALLGTDSNGISVEGTVGSFSNTGTIGAANDGLYVAGNLATASNSGTITARSGVSADADVGSFTNSGRLTTRDHAFHANGSVGAIVNSGSVVNANNPAFSANGLVGSFTNSGTITSEQAVAFDSGVSTFLNTETGTMVATGQSTVHSGGIGSFINHGTLRANATVVDDRQALYVHGTVGSLLNTGLMQSLGGSGAGFVIDGDVGSFTNSGTISGTDLGGLVHGDTGTFRNSGLMTGAFGGFEIGGLGAATLTNTGTLRATGAPTPDRRTSGLWLRNGTLTNTGTISGQYGVTVTNESTGGVEIINSGTITGTGGVAIEFDHINPDTAGSAAPGRTNILRLASSAVINGSVDFGAGSNSLLDLSQYSGSLFLQADNLAAVDGGSNIVVHSGNRVALVDPATISGSSGSGGTGSVAADVTGEISNIISAQLNDIGSAGGGLDAPAPGAASGYAAPRPQTPAEAAAQTISLQSQPALTHTAWASAFGGGGGNGTGLRTVFGGIVAGSHAQVQAGVTLGGLGGYVHSDLTAGSQTVATDTALGGAYGKTDFGAISLNYALTAGINTHHSRRTITGAGTAIGDFSSWFLAPQLGVSIPVLTTPSGQFNVATTLKYVGGGVGGYSETGSLANLTVGSQPVSLLDGRIELNTDQAVGQTGRGIVHIFAKAGLFAQSNLGGSTVPITLLGQTFNSITPGATLYGAFGGLGLTVPVSFGDLTASINASARNDGLVSASGKLQAAKSF